MRVIWAKTKNLAFGLTVACALVAFGSSAWAAPRAANVRTEAPSNGGSLRQESLKEADNQTASEEPTTDGLVIEPQTDATSEPGDASPPPPVDGENYKITYKKKLD